MPARSTVTPRQEDLKSQEKAREAKAEKIKANFEAKLAQLKQNKEKGGKKQAADAKGGAKDAKGGAKVRPGKQGANAKKGANAERGGKGVSADDKPERSLTEQLKELVRHRVLLCSGNNPQIVYAL